MEEVNIDNTGPVSLQTLCLRSKKRSRELFLENLTPKIEDNASYKLYLSCKINSDYGNVKNLPPPSTIKNVVTTTSQTKADGAKPQRTTDNDNVVIKGPHTYPNRPNVTIESVNEDEEEEVSPAVKEVVESMNKKTKQGVKEGHSLIAIQNQAGTAERMQAPNKNKALAIRNPYAMDKPTWHAPWKLMRVISGHLGWVRSVSVDPTNEWFATGSVDRTIKIWDLASGTLKVTLTGHIGSIRGLAVSPRHPYLFSAAEDKMVKCWDLECNKVIRHYHGHLSGVYSLSLHPTLDVLVTGGRDSVARVWDMRTKNSIHVLSGHTNTVSSIITQPTDPQVVTGSHDSCIRLWDLAKGSCYATLTHHKKSVRSLALHPNEYSMASGAPDNLKLWKFPEGKFLKNLSGHRTIVNTLAVNSDNVLVSGADNGSMYFWDWKTGYNFQKMQTQVQPGSLESEAGIFAMTFDHTGSRLITCEADKSIKIYKEDENANEETHPIDMLEFKKQMEGKY